MSNIFKKLDADDLTSDDSPKIFVTDLAAYNEGKLEGEWIKLDDFSSGSEVMEKISELLKQWSDDQGVKREEYFITDYENFPKKFYSEHMGESAFDELYKFKEKADEMSIPMEVLAEASDDTGEDDLDHLAEMYSGEYDDEEDYASSLVDEEVITDVSDYIYISEIDKRILSQEEADSQVDNMDDEEVLNEADLKDEYDELDSKLIDADEGNDAEQIRKEQRDLLERAKSETRDKISERIEGELDDPMQYFVEDHGIYSKEDLVKASFIQVDYEKLARNLAHDYNFIKHDGSTYVFRSYYAKGGTVKYSEGGTAIPGVADNIFKHAFTAAQLREWLKKNFPDSFGVTIVEGDHISGGISPFAEDNFPKDEKFQMWELDYRVFNGEENVYVYFKLVNSSGKAYTAKWGYKVYDASRPGYITELILLLHSDFKLAKGGKADGGKGDGKKDVGEIIRRIVKEEAAQNEADYKEHWMLVEKLKPLEGKKLTLKAQSLLPDGYKLQRGRNGFEIKSPRLEYAHFVAYDSQINYTEEAFNNNNSPYNAGALERFEKLEVFLKDSAKMDKLIAAYEALYASFRSMKSIVNVIVDKYDSYDFPSYYAVLRELDINTDIISDFRFKVKFAKGGEAADVLQEKLLKGKFDIDGGTQYDGYYDPKDDWNGWRIPYFTRKQLEKMQKDLKGQVVFKFNDDRNMTMTEYHGETESGEVDKDGEKDVTEIPAVRQNTVDGYKQLYYWYGWIWDLVPPDQYMQDGGVTDQQLSRIKIKVKGDADNIYATETLDIDEEWELIKKAVLSDEFNYVFFEKDGKEYLFLPKKLGPNAKEQVLQSKEYFFKNAPIAFCGGGSTFESGGEAEQLPQSIDLSDLREQYMVQDAIRQDIDKQIQDRLKPWVEKYVARSDFHGAKKFVAASFGSYNNEPFDTVGKVLLFRHIIIRQNEAGAQTAADGTVAGMQDAIISQALDPKDEQDMVIGDTIKVPGVIRTQTIALAKGGKVEIPLLRAKMKRDELGKLYEQVVGHDIAKENKDYDAERIATIMKEYDDESEKNNGKRDFEDKGAYDQFYKAIEYAYPTSTSATKAGFGKEGSWYLELYDGPNAFKSKTIKHFGPDQEEAIKYAESLPNPYHPLHLKYFDRKKKMAKGGKTGKMQTAVFSLPDSKAKYQGYYNPDESFSFGPVPYFTKDVLMKLLKSPQMKASHKSTFDDNWSLTYVDSVNDNYTDTVSPKTIDTPDGSKEVYEAGFGFAWEIEGDLHAKGNVVSSHEDYNPHEGESAYDFIKRKSIELKVMPVEFRKDTGSETGFTAYYHRGYYTMKGNMRPSPQKLGPISEHEIKTLLSLRDYQDKFQTGKETVFGIDKPNNENFAKGGKTGSILSQDSDLLGKPKEPWMYLTEQLYEIELNHTGNGKFILRNAVTRAGVKKDKSKAYSYKYPSTDAARKQAKKEHKATVEKAIDDGSYHDAVAAGRMTASDAMSIIEDVTLKVPANLTIGDKKKDKKAKGGKASGVGDFSNLANETKVRFWRRKGLGIDGKKVQDDGIIKAKEKNDAGGTFYRVGYKLKGKDKTTYANPDEIISVYQVGGIVKELQAVIKPAAGPLKKSTKKAKDIIKALKKR